MTIKEKMDNTDTLTKVLFYSRELLKIKLSYKKKARISDNFENQKLYKMYKDLKKEIARLSALL
jgi:hypothetical protein